MTLVECSAVHGNTTLYEHDPDCAAFHDVLYMPVVGQEPGQGRSYGLYRQDGSLVRAAGRFRGPDGAIAGPLLQCRHDRAAIAPAPAGPGFLYLGYVTTHYGHFLIDSLCRLWALAAFRGERKILYHGFKSPAEIFAMPFAAEIFSACGLAEADFVKFDQPVLLDEVVVPSPAIEELNYAHRCLATWFNRIGDLICPATADRTRDAPIYLTKARVTAGISRYVNEWDFVARLERAGIRIVSPETLTLREQIRLFKSRGIVTGLIGSAFHTALFAPPRQMLILNYDPVVWSNQILIDQANGATSMFVCEAGGSRNEGPNGHFGNNFMMGDPVRLAEQFLRRIDALDRAARPRPCFPPALPQTCRGMNWYFALSATSFGSPSHDWPNLIRAAVSSALRVTSLMPHFLWDGPEHPFLDELRALGVTVIHHRVSFYEDLAAFKSDAGYLATAAGCFLRTEIPLLEEREAYVLYTDADVVFLSDPVPALSAMRPELFAGAGEFTFVDGLNSGVLLLNVAAMRRDYPGFNRFIRDNLALGLDQDMYRHYYAGRFETLAPVFNWKPYWGADAAAVILHWHGIKPVVARRLLNDPAARTVPELQLLVEQNPAGYRYYIDLFDSILAQPAPTRPAPAASCAVVLVVRDEATDIAAWLAWYHVLGFDACIVYDDDSTDGTWEILQQASAGQDLRLQRSIGQKPGPYEHRQDECYRHAMRTYAREFDWLAFFDADEFLLLNEDPDIKTFLARFPGADAVAINWCNYGSSFHILKPDLPVFEAFTWHGGPHQKINRHVKSIVRPNKVGRAWHNVHCFDLPAESYVLSNGQRPAWSETLGIIAGEPDWNVAKLMHYQCRSMEHFVERMKKRPTLATVRGIWPACDLRDVESKIPERQAESVKAQMRRLRQPVPLATTISAGPDLIFDIGMSEGDDTAFYLAKGFRVVGVEPDIQTYLSLCERFETALKTGRLSIHNCAAGRQAGQIVTFHHHNRNQAISGLFNERPEFEPGSYESYPVMTIDWPALLEKHGAPYFVKIDIEGSETAFLESMAATRTPPEYISVECHQLAPVESLYSLGYRRFKLVDQNPPGGFSMVQPQAEGNQLDWPAWHHDSSGPFGRDLLGEWVDFEEFKRQWHSVQPDYSRTWFDCHAWLHGAPPHGR